MLELTPELVAECAQMLALCEEMKQLEPDVEVSHHKPGCGCPWKIDEETGLFDPDEHHMRRWIGDTKHSVYHTTYPFFICVHCKKLVPWCYGCDNEDPYLAACCDGCWCELTKGGKDA